MTKKSIPYIPPEERAAFQATADTDLWVAPVACGIEARHRHTSIVVLQPGTHKVALSCNFPGRFDAEQVDAWLEEAATHFLNPLCCALDILTSPLELTDRIPFGPCFWVRYDGLGFTDVVRRKIKNGAELPVQPTHPNHRKAVALARRLQDDFDDVEAFHHELYYLSFLRDSVARLRAILDRRFGPDLQRVTRLHHGINF